LKFDKATYGVGKNLFAGGDFVTGPSTVVAGIAAGRQAAAAINHFLNGPQPKVEEKAVGCGCNSVPEKYSSQFLKPAKRNEVIEHSVEKRLKGLDIEEAPGFELNMFKNEANRCLNCSCVAVSPSDLAPALIALNASIVTTKRTIEAEKFFATSINKSTVLADDEIVREVSVPVPGTETKAIFTKFALRKSIDFPVVNCAAVIESENGMVKSARICLNSVYNEPVRVTAAEKMISGQVVDEALAEKAAQAGMADAFSLVNNHYKIKIAGTLVKRAILACTNK
jgi:CO/xanthine dehydrogenase FAD-binding subunit